MGIRVLQPGALTTVQDAGRYGYQSMGFPVSGVMDRRSFRIANMLLGNDETEAVLEAAMLGPSLCFQEDCFFCITGADMQPKLDGVDIPLYTALLGKAGAVLELGLVREGARAYIAFAGGLDIPPVMGSCSTNLKCGIGGWQGRALRAGDEIPFRKPKKCLKNLYKRYEKIRECGERHVTLRAVPGPQENLFTEAGIHTFFSEEYTVTQEYDRMGCRLDGAQIESRGGVDIVSDGIVFGSVQIPASGRPIVMMADHQTTGGYAKIATVISTDLPKLAQRMPGDTVSFEAVSIEEAQRIARKEEAWMRRFRRATN
ncbi:MAG: biotin-dependent carboxyltransferase family protein [Lachnospiraceae bacterium]|nr:biotin-dependent carboxyltransferase family protein [Lachnospiraceae bacterium]